RCPFIISFQEIYRCENQSGRKDNLRSKLGKIKGLKEHWRVQCSYIKKKMRATMNSLKFQCFSDFQSYAFSCFHFFSKGIRILFDYRECIVMDRHDDIRFDPIRRNQRILWTHRKIVPDW